MSVERWCLLYSWHVDSTDIAPDIVDHIVAKLTHRKYLSLTHAAFAPTDYRHAMHRLTKHSRIAKSRVRFGA